MDLRRRRLLRRNAVSLRPNFNLRCGRRRFRLRLGSSRLCPAAFPLRLDALRV